MVLGCGSESTIKPQADANAVVWTKLTQLPLGPTSLYRDVQAVFPDWRGDSIVFSGLDPITANHLRVALVDVKDGASAYVSAYPGPAEWNDITPHWVAPGIVAFSSSRNPAAKFDIYYRNIDTGADHLLFSTSEYETTPIPQPGRPGLAYVEGQENTKGRLVYMPDTANVADRTYLTPPGFKLGEPGWNPAGTRIVFSVDSTAGTAHYRHLWWTAPGDLSPHQLTSGPYVDDYPAFHPDGSTIAFVSDRSGRSSLWLVNPDLGETAGLHRIAWQDPGPEIYGATWSPDGKRIAVTCWSDATGRQIWILSNLQMP